jgi:hypothetical protein
MQKFVFVLFVSLLIPLTAAAESPLVSWAQGTFTCDNSESEIKKKQAAAAKKTLDASSFLVRQFGASKLQDFPHVCRGYQISTTATTMTVTCDDKPTLDIMLDGTPTKYPTENGKTFENVATVNGSKIVQDLRSEKGAITVTYVFSEDKLHVHKQVESDYLGVPHQHTFEYTRK